MKKIVITIIGIFVYATAAMGDIVDEGLPQMATEQIKTSTRQMISYGLQGKDIIEMTRLMLENNFNHNQVLNAHAILKDAHQQGLPVEALMNKAFEGMAKQVHDENIIRAMQQVKARHAFAANQAKALTQNHEQRSQMGMIIAQSLTAGMHQDDATRIMQNLQQRAQHMTQIQAFELAQETFMTARTMARLGHSSTAVADTVCQGLQQGYGLKDMANMRSAVMNNSMASSAKGSNFGMGQAGGPSGPSGSGSGMGDHGGGSEGGMGGSGGGSGGGMGGSGGGSGGGMGGSGGGSGGGMGGSGGDSGGGMGGDHM